MKPPIGTNPTRWLETCVDATFTARVDTENRDLLLAALGIFGSLVYESQTIRRLLPEGIMREFPIIQEFLQEARELGLEHGLERGLERGQKKFAIDLIMEILSEKFQIDAVQTVKPTLEEIDDLKRLKQLLRSIPEVQSLEEFMTLLSE